MQIAQIGPVIGEAISSASQIEKLGSVAILALWACLATYAAYKYQKRLAFMYRSRERERLINVLYKAALDDAEIKVDISEIERRFKEDLAEEALS